VRNMFHKIESGLSLPVYAGLIVSTITLVALLFLYFRRKAHRDILPPSL